MVSAEGADEAVIDFHSQGSVEHNVSGPLAGTDLCVLLDTQGLFLAPFLF